MEMGEKSMFTGVNDSVYCSKLRDVFMNIWLKVVCWSVYSEPL